ncbi:MAG: hypothetical protein KGI54_08805 [Pseudomonadota bacterium]|nr:hypothetical protein [Pseudomonadota bacterium]
MMGVAPKHHVIEKKPDYLGLPIKVVSAFHWWEECENRPKAPDVAYKKTGPKSKMEKEKEITQFVLKGSLTFTQNAQADADKQAKIKGRQNSRRSQ